ncbi:MAG: hypothetical protein J07HX64_00076 [halophilic archaeon J07HX64]|jgi:FHA domain.|nr:MAG: hypothetical protein J07HX64_00076 [halophilic archaeon J07HX64]
MENCRHCDNEVLPDADVCRHCGKPPDEPVTEDNDGLECPDCSADLSEIPSDQLSQCPICMHPLDDTEPTGVSLPPLRECPNCGDGLRRSLSSRECPGCRFDLKRWAERSLEAATDVTRTESERLSGAGVEQVWELHDADPDALSDQTALPAWRIRGWLGDSSPDDSGPPMFTDCPNCGEDLPETGPGWSCPVCPADQGWAGTPLTDEPEITASDQQQLAGAGITTVGQLHATDADTLSDRTDILTWRLTDLREETTPEDSASASCPNCGGELPETGPGWSCPACPADQGWAETPLADATDVTSGDTRRLSGAGITTVGDLHGSDPDALSDRVSISTWRLTDWVEDTSPDEPDPDPESRPGRSTGPKSGQEANLEPEARREPETEPTAGDCPNCGEGLPDASPGWSCPACPADQEWAETPLADVTELAGESTRLLADEGITTLGEFHDARPDVLSARTGISARQVRGWAEDTAPEESSADELTTQIQRSHNELLLEVMGQEFTVTDGETVGREVRKAMVRAGAPEDEAVYVHRKHIRIEAGSNGFRLTRLGQNDLTVNGQTVEKGATVPLGDGDEVGFSNVVTATVTVR